jgi:hypothetical protein
MCTRVAYLVFPRRHTVGDDEAEVIPDAFAGEPAVGRLKAALRRVIIPLECNLAIRIDDVQPNRVIAFGRREGLPQQR